MADELLPCPFCGGEGLEVVTGKAGQNRYKIVCSGCGVKTFETVASPLHRKAWNRRYERTTTMTTDAGSQHWYSCDTCGCDGYAAELPNYCPNCGARVVKQ